MGTVRAGAVVASLTVITAVRIVADEPGFGIAFYALIPIVLAAFWLGRAATLLTAAVASVIYLVSELIRPSATLGGAGLWVAAANRSVIYIGVALIVTSLLRRERELLTQVARQREQLDELESLRAALTPADVGSWPGLEVASCFVPADGLVAGDFFLVTRGPADSTTIVVGDVVGHGLEAARKASYVRAALGTFAAFTADPTQLLQLANTALREREEPRQFVTVTCVNIAATNGQLSWACAGHPAPWRLDNGDVLDGGHPGVPLGLGFESLGAETGSCTIAPGAGVLLFTDGLIEARAAVRDLSVPLELFGEQRAREVLASHLDATPEEVVRALSTSASNFAGGALADDLCVVAFRAVPHLASTVDGDTSGTAFGGDSCVPLGLSLVTDCR